MKKFTYFELKEGMILGEPIFSKESKRLLFNSGTVMTKNKIHMIKKNSIEEINILDDYTIWVEPLDMIKKDIKNILIKEIITHAPRDKESNTSNDMAQVSQNAIDIVEELIKNEIILNFCLQMKIIDNEFLYRHNLTTCALSLLIACSMNLKHDYILKIGIGAILHDLGVCEMPILLHAEERDKQMMAMWNEHPKYGYYIAKEAGLSKDITKMILHHHEFWNGKGFPKKLVAYEIPLGSRIISVCETYDRLIRVDKMPRYQAIEYLYGGGNYYFDSNIVELFTNKLAVYPLGSIVRLTTGEVGIVVNVRKNKGPRPIIKLYYNRVNRPLTYPKYIDLGEERTVFIKQIL